MKRLLILMLLVSNTAFSDEGSNYVEELKSIAKVAEMKAVGTKDVEAKFSEPDTINSLLDEVERLKTRQIVDKRNILSTENPRKSKAVGSKTVYPYIEGRLYEIHAGVDKVTDIVLEPEEKLTNTPVAGDTVRWTIAVLTSGSEKGEITHLVIKPLEEAIETNLIVTTNRRVYHLKLTSSDWYMPQVSWNYPDSNKKEIEKNLKNERHSEAISLSPEELNFGYEIEGKDYDWKPIQVFDDGEKTFIRMPKKISEAPALFIEDEMLVNYRVKGDYFILDRLFEKALLKIGEDKKVTIKSEKFDSGWIF